MSITKKGNYYYGENNSDLAEELIRYSQNNYKVDYTADSVCECGNDTFTVLVSENPGVAVRICTKCEAEHGMGDADEYFDEVETMDEMECICGGNEFKVTSGVSLYKDSEDIRWYYLGLLCTKCGCMGCYGDWKNEYNGYKSFLENV